MIKEDRATRWTNLLKIDKHAMSSLNNLTPDFKRDHPDQQQIHLDCQEIQNQLPMFEESELQEYLELLLTYYCKTENISYTTGMHEVMAAFFLLGFSGLKTVYAAFRLFVKRMMPLVFKEPSSMSLTFKVFHQILMYHEPLLCSALDGKMITPQVFANKWFTTLFASSLNISLLLAFWEFCLQEKNPSLPYFFALVFLSKTKEKILNKKNLSPSDMDLFQFYICELEELDDLCQEALSIQHQTPKSYVDVIVRIISENNCPESLVNSVALTILPSEVQIPKPGLFVIDLRPLDDYTSGHYPQAFNFPKKLKLSTAFYSSKSGRLCHFALCGGSKKRYQNQTNSLCLDIVRRGIERVSLIHNGYVGESRHDWEQCQWCELNRDLVINGSSAEGSNRCNTILNTMWYAFVHDLTSQITTPLSSNGSTPQPFRFISVISDSGKPNKNTEVDSDTILELVKLMWTTGLSESEKWFEERKNEPRCALHWAEGAFLTALLMGTKQARKVALERLEFAEKITESSLKSSEVGLNLLQKCKSSQMKPHDLVTILKEAQVIRMNVVVSAEVFLFRAGSEILQKDYPRGSIHFRNAWKQHKLCEELQTLYQSLESQLSAALKAQLSKNIENDILSMMHFQKGVFLLSLSMAPPSLLRLAKISGMEADQGKGLSFLYKCINSKSGIRVSASLMFVLFWLLVYIPEFAPGKEDRFKEANDLIRFGNHYYPRSIYFSWLESYMCTRQGKLERSLKLLKRALLYATEQGFEIPSPRLLFEKGWVLFLYQEWDQALSCLLTAADHSLPTPFTQLLLAVASCMVGNLDQAEVWFKDLCGQDLEKVTVEKWIGRRARRYLVRRWFQLFPYEVIYVTDFLNDMNLAWLEQVLQFFNDINMPEVPEPSKLSQSHYQETDEYAVLLLLQGSILRNLGRLKESVAVLEKVIKYQSWIMHEKWLIPHAYYELGMIYLKGRDWKTGNAQLMKAKKFKKFDFRRSLNFKLNSALEYISHEEIKESKAVS